MDVFSQSELAKMRGALIESLMQDGFPDMPPEKQAAYGRFLLVSFEMINHELAARWETCCEAVGIDTDATAAEWREAYEAKRAQVRREAAVKALREAADDMDARANKNELIARADRWEGYYSGVRSSILNEASALRARADRMEAGE